MTALKQTGRVCKKAFCAETNQKLGLYLYTKIMSQKLWKIVIHLTDFTNVFYINMLSRFTKYKAHKWNEYFSQRDFWSALKCSLIQDIREDLHNQPFLGMA